MNLRAPSRVASFAIRLTAKIRSRHDFRYKYGCLEISRGDTTGDATGEATRRRKEETRKKKLYQRICAGFYCRIFVVRVT